jgi:hypothetical protein
MAIDGGRPSFGENTLSESEKDSASGTRAGSSGGRCDTALPRAASSLPASATPPAETDSLGTRAACDELSIELATLNRDCMRARPSPGSDPCVLSRIMLFLAVRSSSFRLAEGK